MYYTKEMICLWMFSFVLRIFLLLFLCSSSCFAVIIVERNSYQAKVHISLGTHTHYANTIQSLARGDSDWGQNNLHAPALAHSLFSSFVLVHENMGNFVSVFVVSIGFYSTGIFCIIACRKNQMFNACTNEHFSLAHTYICLFLVLNNISSRLEFRWNFQARKLEFIFIVT